jgi:hypothetical protein
MPLLLRNGGKTRERARLDEGERPHPGVQVGQGLSRSRKKLAVIDRVGSRRDGERKCNGTTILKFYLHISPEEQLSRLKQRLDDPSRHWKISESDYSERELWPQHVEVYEDAMAA